MKTTVTLNGQKYNLDINRGIELGILTVVDVNRPLKFKDLKNGDIFQWRFKNGRGWSVNYVMLDIDKRVDGQAINMSVFPASTWFSPEEDSDVIFRKYDIDKRVWVETTIDN